MDEQELRAAAERAIAAGADPEAVYARLDSLLAETQGSRAQEAQREVQLATDPRAGSSLSPMQGGVADFLRMMGQSASMEFGDEIAGDSEYLDAIRRENPGAAAAGQVATAALPLPALVGGGVGALRAGAGAGALGGATTAMGMGEGTLLDRLASKDVPVGMALGAALGGAFPAAGAVLRRRGLRGRVAGALEDASGVRRADRAQHFEDVRALRGQAKAGYRNVEDQFPGVADSDVTEFIRELKDSPSQQVRGMVNKIADDETPSVPELQTLRSNLRKKGFGDDAERLTGYMNRIPGFREADDLYYQASQAQRVFQKGREAGRLGVNMSGDDIRRAVEGLSDADQFIFRRGQVTELLERIARREEGNTDGVKLLLEGGESVRDVLRTMFPTERTYQEFMDVLATERNVERASALVRRYLPWLGVGGAGFVGGSVMN